MARSRWPFHVLLAITVIILTASLLANILHVRANQRGKLFVLIQGLNTNLQGNTPPTESFGTRNGIASYLSRVYPDAKTLMYSYNGDTSNGSPISYQCQDTFATDAKGDALKLAKQLQDYLKDKTNVDVYLIAHSFGGLITYGYLSYLMIQRVANGNIPGTTGDRIAGVVTLDTPLGGIPNDLYLAKLFLWYSYVRDCPQLVGQPMPSLDQIFNLYKTSKLLPHGGYNSIASVLFNNNITNQTIADEALNQGIHTLTIGNTLDYVFNPAACNVLLGHSMVGTENYLSTQWLSDRGAGSGIYGHYFTDGIPTCNNLDNLGINHGLAFIERSVQGALGQFINNTPLSALPAAIQGM